MKNINTVKLGLTTTSKRQPSAQDDRFWSVPVILVRDISIKQCIKDYHLSSVTANTPNWTKSDQIFTKDDRIIFTWLVLPRR